MRKTFEKIFVPTQICHYGFWDALKSMLHVNHCFIIPKSHVKNSALKHFIILRYFGQREDIY